MSNRLYYRPIFFKLTARSDFIFMAYLKSINFEAIVFLGNYPLDYFREGPGWRDRATS